jgi:hypothetical protein
MSVQSAEKECSFGTSNHSLDTRPHGDGAERIRDEYGGFFLPETVTVCRRINLAYAKAMPFCPSDSISCVEVRLIKNEVLDLGPDRTDLKTRISALRILTRYAT